MKINEIRVPDYVNYISDWVELQIPQGHFIMDKTITGCGFTEYFLRNTQNVVLCSPRKVLLENKAAQNKEIFYVKNEMDKGLFYDCEVAFGDKSDRSIVEKLDELLSKKEQEDLKRKAYITQLKQNISDYIDYRGANGKPFKILVTYDSLKHVLDVLREKFSSTLLNTLQFVVDEFQSIFSDARFKGNVELDFLDFLQDCNNVCFLSATPMIKEYLEQMDEFKDLPYYKLLWGSDKVTRASIIRKPVSSIMGELGNIIEQYRNGHFPRKILEDKSIHESKEVVFYVNSVKTICSIVKKYGLTPDETNIICSRDDKNKRKLRAVKHTFGEIPLQGQPHKMFTFCTRTVYIGSDFYSESAYTVVVSDCNIDTLSVDIALDLPQILGRQRLKSNVFRNECLLFYKTQKDKITKDMFAKKIAGQKENSKNIFSLFAKGTTGEKGTYTLKIKAALKDRYKDDFVSISTKTGQPAYNKLIELAEWRAWEVSQKEYQDDITVRRILESDYDVYDVGQDVEYKTIDLNSLECYLMEKFNEVPFFHEKMRVYCDFLDQYGDLFKTTNIGGVPREFQNYVNLLGTKRIKALQYRQNECENEYKIIVSTGDICKLVFENYQENTISPSSEIKPQLQQLYDSLGLKKKAKATDLGEYFEIEQITTRINGKLCKAINILRRKN